MIPPKKSDLTGPKRVIEWFYEPDESPEDQLLKQLQGAWRLIAERPPPANLQVLVTDGKSLAFGRMDAYGKLQAEGGLQPLTHWLPLPAPPEPVADKGGKSIFRHNNAWRRY